MCECNVKNIFQIDNFSTVISHHDPITVIGIEETFIHACLVILKRPLHNY